jgi:hypothetical protein
MVDFVMTKLLDQAIATLKNLPEAEQDIAARFLLDFANPQAHRHQLSEAQLLEVELAKHEVCDGKVATDAEMAEVWQRFGS